MNRRRFLRWSAVLPLALRHGRALAAPGEPPREAERSPPRNRVVHVREARATRWDYRTGWYGDFVDPDVVDRMTDRGVMELTGTSTRADAGRYAGIDYVQRAG